VLCSGERLSEAKLDWYRLDGTGDESLYFTVLMQNAQIVKIESWVPDALDKANAVYGYMENVWFTYEMIRWTWQEDGIEYEENWGTESNNR
jgi:type VI secretion system secreted protein Hcp